MSFGEIEEKFMECRNPGSSLQECSLLVALIRLVVIERRLPLGVWGIVDASFPRKCVISSRKSLVALL